ncbi:MAG: Omp28 family outer membrane lipoprotein [Bacteroidales bacterium]|jgi:hypothetical protein|nr:Omp28 family outer membrane lipoprotein [Bacteroidales bacterium]
MKKLSLFALTAIILGMMSCDKLKEPYFTEPIVQQSDTIALTAADTLNFDGKIVVLLEDYTGVRCVNCPAAAELAASLQTQYGEHLVVLGVHPKTSYQNPAGGFPDFRTDDGNEWNSFFNVSAYPTGMVNRQSAIGTATWATEVDNLIGNDAPVRLIIKSEYDDATRELKLSIHSKFLQNVASDDVRLTVCMMENNIVGLQLTPNGADENYVHRHVFRGTADGLTWGRTLDTEAESIAAGRNFITNMKFTVNEDYNADEFYIVAMISDNNTKQVLMTAEKKIK